MFTGIVEEVGRVSALDPQTTGARLSILCRSVLVGAEVGASIAVNGACLTAVELSQDGFRADVSPETLKRTNLGALQPGAAVNLERPLRLNARLDGHFVLGHVDGTGEVLALDELGNGNWWLRVRIAPELTRYVVEKGSVAVDGISLTLAALSEDVLEFTIIPHTYSNTTLRTYSAGARVNIEVDILAKHIEKFMQSVRR
ncbi:MAG: riboflavin synthase [Acidobacteriaceae bacterium]|nr:riboflavin synthase [Acidobacteriaceae bacterium]